MAPDVHGLGQRGHESPSRRQRLGTRVGAQFHHLENPLGDAGGQVVRTGRLLKPASALTQHFIDDKRRLASGPRARHQDFEGMHGQALPRVPTVGIFHESQKAEPVR